MKTKIVWFLAWIYQVTAQRPILPQQPPLYQAGIVNGRIDDVMNLIASHGYTYEAHRVETQDGYLLKMHRILPRIVKEKKGPVLLVHGLFGTSADFVLSGPQFSLAYHLANDGYDVWMGNCRGSKFSMRHRVLNPASREFWHFSFHEIGMFDYPAFIEYMLKMTGKLGVYFIGHNQANSAMLAFLSTRPDYQTKIFQMHMMAPVAWMDYIHPFLSFNIDRNMRNFYRMQYFNFFSLTDFTNMLIKGYCDDRGGPLLRYCIDLWTFVFGRNRNGSEMDPLLILDVPKYISPTASTRQWNHYLQIYKTGKFQTYDGSEDSFYEGYPQEYNLKNIRVPTYAYHAAEDLVVNGLDVEHLTIALQPNVKAYKVIANWNHMDFLFSRNGRIMLYDYILNALNGDIDLISYVKNLLG